MTGGAADLVTVHEFGDFELSLEWKIGKGVNSGIIYRVGMSESQTYETGPEYQLLDNPNTQESPVHFAGALYDLVPADADYTKPFGEWNKAHRRSRLENPTLVKRHQDRRRRSRKSGR
jgi:hypothetical protein